MRTIIILLLIGLSACNSAEKQPKERNEEQSTTLQTFPIPEIPVMYTTEELRREFLTLHFWDAYDFADTTLVGNLNITEQGLANYLSLLMDNSVTSETLQQSLNNFCRSMEKSETARKKFMNWMDSYLYDPNSPMYNEKVYICYLQTMQDSPVLTDAHKESLRFKADLIGRNSVGEKATSFSYTLADGRRGSLYRTPVHNRLLLLFYDPECPHCQEIMQQIVGDNELSEQIRQKKVSVLAIYTEGNHEVWRDNLPKMPEEWIVGTDQEQIKTEALYDLKAMPVLYLLDKDMNVLLKDASYPIIRNYLKGNN